MKALAAVVAASLVVFGVACSGGSDASSAGPSGGDGATEPTATRAVISATTVADDTATATATRTPVPTATAVPTDTPEPPTATPEPPTATPEPPTPIPPPPPTETPVPLQPAPTQPPAPTGGAQSLFINAASLQFSPGALYAVAGGTVTITMSNQDTRVPHNIAVAGLGTSATCTGPCSASVSFATPSTGNYAFLCSVHPFMKGTLVVQ